MSIIHLKNDIVNTIYLSTDQLSVRPLFWSKSNSENLFGFSSLLSGLCEIKQFDRINRLNQNECLIYDCINNKYNILNYYNKIYNFSNDDDNIYYIDNSMIDITNILTNCVIKRL